MRKITFTVPIKIEVDLDSWALTYGMNATDDNVKVDALSHIPAIVRENVAQMLKEHGAGARVK